MPDLTVRQQLKQQNFQQPEEKKTGEKSFVNLHQLEPNNIRLSQINSRFSVLLRKWQTEQKFKIKTEQKR